MRAQACLRAELHVCLSILHLMREWTGERVAPTGTGHGCAPWAPGSSSVCTPACPRCRAMRPIRPAARSLPNAAAPGMPWRWFSRLHTSIGMSQHKQMFLERKRPLCVGLTVPMVDRHNRVAGFMKRNPDANAEPMDIEDLTALGNSASGPCPYFLSREMAATADIIFMPAGFLFPCVDAQRDRDRGLQSLPRRCSLRSMTCLLWCAVQLSDRPADAHGTEAYTMAQLGPHLR